MTTTTTYLGDWSNHDHQRGLMDWWAMAADGIAGGTHKTSDGLRYYRDPYWAEAIRGMRHAFAQGLYGSYHVLWGDRDVTAQVDWWLSILDDTAPSWRDDDRFLLMTDNEPFGYNTPPTIGHINQAGDRIAELTGKRMLAYCPPWHYGSTLAGLRYPHVTSNYATNPAVHYPDAYPGPTSARWLTYAGKAWALQYGSQTIMGTQQTCDANAVLQTVPAIRATLTPRGGHDMSEQAEHILAAIAAGEKTYVNADGATVELVPTTEVYRQIAFRAEVGQAVADVRSLLTDIKTLLGELAARPAGTLTDGQAAAMAGQILPALGGVVRTELVNAARRLADTGDPIDATAPPA